MVSIKEKEEALIKAGEKLGEIMAKADPETKKILKRIKTEVEKVAHEQEEKGCYIDRSSVYAIAIIMDDELDADPELAEAIKEYITADHEYIKALKDIQ